MKIALLSIGNELLSGNTINSNAAWIANELTTIGCEIENQITVQDKEESIVSGLDFCLLLKPTYLIITGGLGPTDDDITMAVLLKFLKIESEFDSDYWDQLKKRFNRSGLSITDSNKNQALKPKFGSIIPNPKGSARGLKLITKETTIIALPGVPLEMKSMINEFVKPQIIKLIKTRIYSKTLRTTGIPESSLFDMIKNQDEQNSNSIGYYPSAYGVDIRISNNRKEKLNNFADHLYKILGDNIYGEDKIRIEEVIVKTAIDKKKTIAVAESCTGGLIGNRITNVANSSIVFKGSAVTYSNQSKVDILGIEKICLKEFGAVSKQTAKQMAENVKKLFGTTYGISVTGISGPGGGTKDKPIGLTYIGLAKLNETSVSRFVFGQDREINKLRTSQAALNMLRKTLINE
ncbi:MAG: competence/damage-inducible protein A [Candidatus Marinimicrobia bacterium]|nr:competence/damage-inducible protein A [Candidatus Neomarinimicrobiota bacterium]|tara:strand:+ start:704 stop:1921 length:1218 start_codon:yes stop_codon:yes gene_type:complete